MSYSHRQILFATSLLPLLLSILIPSDGVKAWRGDNTTGIGAESDPQGVLSLICTIEGASPNDIIACRVTIDGIAQPDAAVDQAVTYTLDPGSHTVLAEIVGEQAALFSPSSVQQDIRISAGKTANLRAAFTKKGHLFVSLDQPGVVADFFVDGIQVAAQVATLDLWVTSKTSHRVEARSLTDPASAGVYVWKDARQYVFLRAGQDRSTVIKLRKQYLKGFLIIKCNASGTTGAYCTPKVNDTWQPAIAAGESIQYTLDPGQYSIIVVPGPTGIWKPASLARKVSIRAGSTRSVNATFVMTQPPPTSESSPAADRSPILTMGGCNAEFRGYRWGPANPATFAGYESTTMMTSRWSPPECRPDSNNPARPSRELTPAECAIYYYRPLKLVLFPNRPFNGSAYYDDVARLIRHIESYEDELGISRSKKVVLGPVSYEGGGVIGSPDAVIVLGAGVVDLPDIIEKTRIATGFMAALDNTHLAVSPYFFGVVDIVVQKALKGPSRIYTIEPNEIPPYVP